MGKDLVGMDHEKLIVTLQSSLYVGARRDSVEMVINYCQAAGLDPMQKPVHIVPMNTRDATTGNYAWRDVIMPGIGLYRIQADRSGSLAGASEPEFGPDITGNFKTKEGTAISVVYPEWCKVSMKKLVGNHIVEFIAKEYWIENYASAGKATAPNAMWKKRPKGQLAKCAEAQALRKGWPEIGQAPTAEEMEGKEIDMGNVEAEKVIEPEQILLPVYPDEKFQNSIELWKIRFKEGSSNPEHIINMISAKYTLTEDQIKKIKEGE